MFSIPEIAAQLVDEMNKNKEENAKTLILAGSKSVGKSTILYSVLDKTDTPRETLVLEYSFGRKTNQKQSLEKIICHIWEYGGKLDLLNSVLTSIPLRGKCIYCVMIDLSKIKTIWTCMDTCIKAFNDLRKGVENSESELVIIGGKYDIFKNYDNEIKKVVCTTLRSVSLINNAHLYFYSSKETVLARKIKDVLYGFGFKTSYELKDKITNYAKPLYIPKDTDSWELIGLSPMTIEEVKMKHTSRIPLDLDVVPPDNVDSLGPQRAHIEPILDAMTNAKYQELRNLKGLDISIDDYLNNKIH